jgi:hypothetical protein
MMKLKKIRWVGLVALRVKMRNVHILFVGKRKWRKPCRRPRCRYKGNIKMEHKEIGWETVNWISVDWEASQ